MEVDSENQPTTKTQETSPIEVSVFSPMLETSCLLNTHQSNQAVSSLGISIEDKTDKQCFRCKTCNKIFLGGVPTDYILSHMKDHGAAEISRKSRPVSESVDPHSDTNKILSRSLQVLENDAKPAQSETVTCQSTVGSATVSTQDGVKTGIAGSNSSLTSVAHSHVGGCALGKIDVNSLETNSGVDTFLIVHSYSENNSITEIKVIPAQNANANLSNSQFEIKASTTSEHKREDNNLEELLPMPDAFSNTQEDDTDSIPNTYAVYISQDFQSEQGLVKTGDEMSKGAQNLRKDSPLLDSQSSCQSTRERRSTSQTKNDSNVGKCFKCETCNEVFMEDVPGKYLLKHMCEHGLIRRVSFRSLIERISQSVDESDEGSPCLKEDEEEHAIVKATRGRPTKTSPTLLVRESVESTLSNGGNSCHSDLQMNGKSSGSHQSVGVPLTDTVRPVYFEPLEAHEGSAELLVISPNAQPEEETALQGPKVKRRVGRPKKKRFPRSGSNETKIKCILNVPKPDKIETVIGDFSCEQQTSSSTVHSCEDVNSHLKANSGVNKESLTSPEMQVNMNSLTEIKQCSEGDSNVKPGEDSSLQTSKVRQSVGRPQKKQNPGQGSCKTIHVNQSDDSETVVSDFDCELETTHQGEDDDTHLKGTSEVNNATKTEIKDDTTCSYDVNLVNKNISSRQENVNFCTKHVPGVNASAEIQPPSEVVPDAKPGDSSLKATKEKRCVGRPKKKRRGKTVSRGNIQTESSQTVISEIDCELQPSCPTAESCIGNRTRLAANSDAHNPQIKLNPPGLSKVYSAAEIGHGDKPGEDGTVDCGNVIQSDNSDSLISKGSPDISNDKPQLKPNKRIASHPIDKSGNKTPCITKDGSHTDQESSELGSGIEKMTVLQSVGETKLSKTCGRVKDLNVETAAPYKGNSLNNESENGSKESWTNCNICGKELKKDNIKAHMEAYHKLGKEHQCNVCEKFFYNNGVLKRHMKIHTIEKTYKCNHCPSTFGEHSKLKRHLNTHTMEYKGKRATCHICGKELRKDYIKSHMEAFHKSVKKYQCNICKKFLYNQSVLNRHMKIHSGEKPYKCNQCSSTFRDLSNLRSHLKTHTRVYTCETCDYTCSSFVQLRRHKNEHYEGQVFGPCEVCGATFRYKYSLRQHIKESHQTEHKCDMCGEVLFSLKSYRKHKSQHRVDGIRQMFRCDHCEKTFKHKRSLKLHRLKHTNSYDYSCDLCRKRFLSLTHRNKHVREAHVHKRKKTSLMCEFCSKMTSSRQCLREHIQRKHSNLKLFKCECGLPFAVESDLKMHMRQHTGEKPYKCQICDKAFARHAHLYRHRVEAHSKTKPYKCSLCGNEFRFLSSFWKHKRYHSEERPYKCSLCKTAFKDSRTFRKHQRTKAHMKNVGPKETSSECSSEEEEDKKQIR